MGEVWMMLRAGTKFYLRVQGQTGLQRNSLISLRWLSKDLAESAPLSFRHYDPDNPSVTTNHNGLVFGSARDSQGRTFYDPDDGRLLWTSMTGYYIEPNTSVLYRIQQDLPDRETVAPVVDDTLHHIDLLAALPNPRVIAKDAVDIDTIQGPSSVDVTLQFRNEQYGFGLKVRTRLEMKNT